MPVLAQELAPVRERARERARERVPGLALALGPELLARQEQKLT